MTHKYRLLYVRYLRIPYREAIVLDFHSRTVRTLLQLITYTVVLYLGLQNLGAVARGISWLLGILSPLLIGFGIAFVLNVPLTALEERIFPLLPWRENRLFLKIRRPLAIALSLLFTVGLLLLLILLILPQLRTSLLSLAQVLPAYLEDLRDFSVSFLGRWGVSPRFLERLTLDEARLEELLAALFSQGEDSSLAGAVGGAVNLAGTLVHGFVNLVFGFTFALYMPVSYTHLEVPVKPAHKSAHHHVPGIV